MLSGTAPGEILMQRLDDLARCSEPGPGLTRRPFTSEHRAANDIIAGWMHEAGLEVSLDAAGTLIGRREGPAGSKTLLMGSHQDSIRQGGRYDGMLGIALPILVLERLQRAQLGFAVEVLAFADEEGVRFPTALLGPRALAGTLDPAVLELIDADGIVLAEALAEFGGSPDGLVSARRDPAGVLGYLEIHIEQGPVLEQAGLPVGIVTGICGIERWTVRLTGKAAHAGTTPMDLRRDAFAGAAESALAVEARCRDTKGLVGVVGSLEIEPNVVNAIPGACRFSVELRAADDTVRAEAADHLTAAIEAIADRRGLEIQVSKTYAQKGVPCDAALSARLTNCVAEAGIDPLALMSGATHDASAMADLCPVAMLFTRCRDGLSHHPEEAVEAVDLTMAATVVERFLESLGPELA